MWVIKEFKDFFFIFCKVLKMLSLFYLKGVIYFCGVIGFFFFLIELGKGSRMLNKGV